MPKIKSKQLNPHFTGSFDISGSLAIDGQLIARQIEADTKALIVSGAMDIAKSAVASASIAIENLGTWGDRDLASIIDLGEFQ